jgi:hypothetical protein
VALLAPGQSAGERASARGGFPRIGEPGLQLEHPSAADVREREAGIDGERARETLISACIGREHAIDAFDVRVEGGRRRSRDGQIVAIAQHGDAVLVE